MRHISSLRELFLVAALAGSSLPILVQVPDAGASPAADSARTVETEAGGGRAAVLLNLRGSIDGKAVTRIGSPVSNNVFAVYLANVDELSAPEMARPYRLDKRAAAAGWYAWQLRPGLYHLLILPPGLGQNPPAAAYHAPSGRFGRLTRYEFKPGRGAFWSPELSMYVLDGPAPADFEPLHGFVFQVPSGQGVVYLGSLSNSCKAGRGLFGGLIDSCGDFELADDTAGAQQLASQAFPGLTVEARPMMRYGEPAPQLRLGDLAATSVSSEAPASVAAGVGGTALGPWATVHGAGQVFMVYNLLAATFEMAKSAQEERQAEEAAARLAPCMQRLGASMDPAGYQAALLQALEQAAGAQGVAMPLPGEGETDAAEPGYRLTARTPVLRLVASGGPESLALGLVVDLRLYGNADRGLRYASLLSSGPESSARTPFIDGSPLYLRPVERRPPARAVAEWCGDGGPALLAEDIESGLRAIAEQFVRDFER